MTCEHNKTLRESILSYIHYFSHSSIKTQLWVGEWHQPSRKCHANDLQTQEMPRCHRCQVKGLSLIQIPGVSCEKQLSLFWGINVPHFFSSNHLLSSSVLPITSMICFSICLFILILGAYVLITSYNTLYHNPTETLTTDMSQLPFQSNYTLGDSPLGVTWFMQASDLHLGRTEELGNSFKFVTYCY